VEDPNDPFALVLLEGDALASEPSRLVEEAHTIPLFGGKRAVWVKPGSRNYAPAIEALLAAPPIDCRVVIEAGDLRKTSPLRSLCEKAKAAAAIPCYADTERDLARLVDEEMREARLTIEPDARGALVSLIGGDRRGSRNEIRKLVLYAHGKGSVTLEDVFAVVADASALALDSLVDATFAGRTGEVETLCSKALSAGTSAGTIIYSALRHVTQLHKARLAIDSGDRPEETLYRAFIPPIHFRREAAVKAALSAWSAPRLQRVMEQLADVTLAMRRTPDLAEAMGQRALLSLAVSARRRD
jgi:DNA polymerase-3 subunit delta